MNQNPVAYKSRHETGDQNSHDIGLCHFFILAMI
jgi:hypothetical protein